MSCEAETERALRASGSRVTTPRLRIALALRHLGGHRTAEEIHAAAGAADPRAAIALPTVYRTLSTLRECGLIAKIDAPHAKTTYAWVDQRAPHHHLVCVRCGAELPLDQRVLDDLRRAIERESDFAPHLGHLAIPGLCSACRRAS
jgi:Fur family transcriptional regulator, ferric uptake regulator